MVVELSVLIPVYNYNVTALVKTLHQQCGAILSNFEIRLYDDGSTDKIQKQNTIGLLNLPHTYYKILPQHLGRAAIRNKLAQDALYATILLLDNDSEIVQPDFIRNYLIESKEGEILIGGTCYSQQSPPPAYRLHWHYGRSREQKTALQRNKWPYHSFHLNNIFLPKKVLLQFPLQELQYGYGHEDSVFGQDLQLAGIKVRHIDNPVLHVGLEKTETYLQKSREAVLNLHYLYSQNKLGAESKLIRLYEMLRKTKSLAFFIIIYNKLEATILKQLQSSNPSLWLLDLYKLYIFASQERLIKRKNKLR